jgi:hypothetical protein
LKPYGWRARLETLQRVISPDTAAIQPVTFILRKRRVRRKALTAGQGEDHAREALQVLRNEPRPRDERVPQGANFHTTWLTFSPPLTIESGRSALERQEIIVACNLADGVDHNQPISDKQCCLVGARNIQLLCELCAGNQREIRDPANLPELHFPNPLLVKSLKNILG